jgi:hypothetical protein
MTLLIVGHLVVSVVCFITFIIASIVIDKRLMVGDLVWQFLLAGCPVFNVIFFVLVVGFCLHFGLRKLRNSIIGRRITHRINRLLEAVLYDRTDEE